MPRLSIALFAILLLAAAIPDDAAVARIRKQIEDAAQARAIAQQDGEILKFTPLTGMAEDDWPDLTRAGNLAILRIRRESDTPPLALRLIRADSIAEPVSLPAQPRGDQWLALDPGQWRIEAIAGNKGSEKIVKLSTSESQLAPHARYELRIGDNEKQRILEKFGD